MFYLTVGWDLAFTAGEVDVVPTRYSLLYCVPQLCPSNLKFLATPLFSCECISVCMLLISPGDDELSGEVIAAIVLPLLFLIVCVVVVITVLLVWKRHGGSCK